MGAIYKGLQFKTALEARWAAFFDLAGWGWHVNPACAGEWSPDFWVRFPCLPPDDGYHTLLVAVLPVDNIEGFGNHPALRHAFTIAGDPQGIHNLVEAGAVFGSSPEATMWVSAHASGRCTLEVPFFVPDAHELWLLAGKSVLNQSVMLD